MKKDILFLCQYFYPDQNSSATLPFDTAEHLASTGKSVGALVGYPKEYIKEKSVPVTENVAGVDIHRVRYLQLDRTGKFGRLINFFSFTARMLLKSRFLRDYKTVVVYSNPPILPIVAIRAKRKYGTKFVFVAYDVYPEVAYASKTLRPGSMISRVMNQINTRLYETADMVIALTDEMKDFLLNNRPGLTQDRVTTIPNWAHENKTDVTPEMYEKFGYTEDQFIVSYFGNMGTCQDMNTMMDAAEELKDNEGIRFLIVGHGNKKEAIRKRIEEQNLKNVQLIDFLTGEDFRQAVAISSCYVVSLEAGLMGTCAPSKYYSYLQGGKPVLAIVEEGSYLFREVKEEEIGSSVRIGDVKGLKAAINRLQKDTDYRSRAGAKALSLYNEKYSKEKAMKKYSDVFAGLLG